MMTVSSNGSNVGNEWLAVWPRDTLKGRLTIVVEASVDEQSESLDGSRVMRRR